MDAAQAANAAEELAGLDAAPADILRALRLAADPSSTSPQFVVALDGILDAYPGPPLAPTAFAAIMDALKHARDAAVGAVHPAIQREKLHSCIEAAAGLVCFWSMSPAERTHVDPDAVVSSVALARILRNSLESIRLVEMLHEQERKRLQSAVDRIKADALSIIDVGGACAG